MRPTQSRSLNAATLLAAFFCASGLAFSLFSPDFELSPRAEDARSMYSTSLLAIFDQALLLAAAAKIAR
jgi:hypothetical protein